MTNFHEKFLHSNGNKLIYISRAMIPSHSANSIHIMKMCQAFVKIGFDTELIAPYLRGHSESCDNSIFDEYGISPIFKLKKISSITYKNNFFMNKISTANYCLSIARYLKKTKPGLVYGRYAPGCYIACHMGIPTIYEAHTKVWKRHAEHILVKKMIRNPNFVKIVVISKTLKKLFQEKYNVPDNKIIVAPDGADPIIGGSQTIKPWKGRIGCLQVGYAGSVYRGRGIGVIDKIARRMEDVDFHIIGANKRKVESHLKRIIPQNLYCHGRVPHSMIYLYLNSCDVLIAPYQSTVCIYGNEGNTADIMSPLKIFEYMACGKAIIASDMDVLHEIIDQENAMLVNSTKVDHWIKAIESMKNEEKRRILGINAANKFLNNYTWNIRAKNIIFNNNGCC